MSTADEYPCMVCGHYPRVHGLTTRPGDVFGPDPCLCCESTFAVAVQQDLFGECG